MLLGHINRWVAGRCVCPHRIELKSIHIQRHQAPQVVLAMAFPDLNTAYKSKTASKGTSRITTDRTSPRQTEQRRYTTSSSRTSDTSSEKQRLSKVLAAAGVASRRASEEIIAQGLVKVNGQVVTSQVLVDPAKDRIEYQGKKLSTAPDAQQFYYFAVNKPKGYICSAKEPGREDQIGRDQGKRAIDLLKEWIDTKWLTDPANKGKLPPRFFTVGRLDVATAGLIFLTNDGTWANDVIHPSSDLTKEYIVLVDKAPSRAQLERMMDGVDIDGVKVYPEEVSLLQDSVRIRVVVKEGKKHEAPGTPQHAQHTQQAGSAGRRQYVSTTYTAQREHSSTPRFDSSRLIITFDGIQMWAWDVGAWMLSKALVARDAMLKRTSEYQIIDPWSDTSWEQGSPTRVRQRGKYKSGLPHRTPIAVYWKFQPFKPSLAPPNLLSLKQVDARGRASHQGRMTPSTTLPSVDVRRKDGDDRRDYDEAACFLGPETANDFDQVKGALTSRLVATESEHSTQGQSLVTSSVPATVGLGSSRRRAWLKQHQQQSNAYASNGASINSTKDSVFQEQAASTETGLSSQLHNAGDEVAAASSSEGSMSSLIDLNESDWKVRLLAAAADLEVLNLKRVRIGGFRMPHTLGIGQIMQLGTKDIKKVTDKAAEQMALAKDPSEQKGKKKDRSGIPDAEELAAILEPGAKPKTKSSYRPPRRRDDN